MQTDISIYDIKKKERFETVDQEGARMFGKHFQLNEETMHIVEEIGRHMPGGFFIYRSEGQQELLFANRAVFDIFGCGDLEEFRELTGYTFKGMLHPEDYEEISDSIRSQIDASDEQMDYVEYRIIRKDGSTRWVEDYGHRTETEAYGDISYVFISDITEKKEQAENDKAIRQAVIESLSETYHTVWLINDVQTESFSLYRGDIIGTTAHAAPIRDALTRMKYSQAKDYYIRTMTAPEEQERLQQELSIETITENVKEKNRYNVTYLRRMEDGSNRYFRIEFARMDMPGGRMGVVCGFKDVDEEIREEEAIRKALLEGRKAEEENHRLVEEIESAAKLAELMGSVASLMTNMPAMSFSKDAVTGKYLACNQYFAEYAHKPSPEGVIGLTDHDIFDKDTADHFVEDDAKALTMDKPYIFFEDVPDAAGELRHLQTTKLKFTDDTGRLCTLGMCVDVTEMTRMKEAETESRIRAQELEEKLALQEEILEQQRQKDQQEKMLTALAADYWSVYYLELDRNWGICYQSHSDVVDGFKVGEEFPYLESVTAYAKQYITEAYLDEFLDFIQPENIIARLQKERVIGYRYMVHRNGHDSYEMVRFAGVRSPGEGEEHLAHKVSACFTDVDAETRSSLAQNEALTQALMSAEEANRAKTAFLSNMSHEIRTPMNAIIGLDNIALNDPDLTERSRECLEKIGASAQHLLGIINDILDMSRIESGRMTLKNEEFSFSKALEQVNTMISGQCRDKKLDYECRIRGTIDDYYIGDDMKLRQIMINILSNAVKFTPEGGSVTFTVEETARLEDKSTLKLTISDTGIGMSPEYLPRLFDAFTQEDSSTTSKYGSTGLGMPIMKNLVEMMNGHVEVASEKDVGTTFTVMVTLTRSGRKDETSEDEIQAHELSILVIDDDPVACEHAQIVLGQVGIDCDIAGSGAEGLRMVEVRHARRDPYHLILVDWKMPEMDGVETTRRIRELVGDETPIIILTSYHWDDVAEEAREAGVDGFVPKPLFAATVIDEFREAFRKKNLALMQNRTDLKGRRILLAEDMMVNAEIMVMVLAMREIETEVAENGRIALEMVEEHEPGYYDAVLMDMRMPEMDGLEATRRIRALDREDVKTLPIIALTANAFDEDVQRSMQAGLNAHLSKPVEPEALFETLEKLIQS